MNFIASTPMLETRIETQAGFYPTLRQLVRLLAWDHKRVVSYLQAEAKDNPFLMESSGSLPQTESREALLGDILPEWYQPPNSGLTLQEHLHGQISALSISSRQREALLYLTQWLSPAGYLEETPETWAIGSSWSAWELVAVVPLLQSLDPPGIGARSLRECLLLQLQDQPQSLSAHLVRDYLEELANCTSSSPQARQNCEVLLQKLQNSHHSLVITMETMHAAIQQIQALEPRPARNFSSSSTLIVTPDLKAEPQKPVGWQVSLVNEASQRFCLNQEALNLLQQSNGRSPDIQRLEALLQKARSLLTALHQWQENLLKVGQFLVERQQVFLISQDALDLLPTPQQMVAQAVGLSNATVSRIVRGRYLLVCAQQSRTIPLQSLCVPVTVGGRTPQHVQQFLVQLIQAEPPTQPYSDEQLAQLLKLRFGISIARRTVAKYRKILGLEPAHARRRAQSINPEIGDD